MEEKVRAIIAELNSLSLGELDAILRKLDGARADLDALGQRELSAKVAEARSLLGGGDIAGFRRTVLQVLSKLGHVRPGRGAASDAAGAH